MARLILVRAIVQFVMTLFPSKNKGQVEMKQEIKKRVSANFWFFAVSRRGMFNIVVDSLWFALVYFINFVNILHEATKEGSPVVW